MTATLKCDACVFSKVLEKQTPSFLPFLKKLTEWQPVALTTCWSSALHTCQDIFQLLKPACPPALAVVPVCQTTEPDEESRSGQSDIDTAGLPSLLVDRSRKNAAVAFTLYTSFSYFSPTDLFHLEHGFKCISRKGHRVSFWHFRLVLLTPLLQRADFRFLQLLQSTVTWVDDTVLASLYCA